MPQYPFTDRYWSERNQRNARVATPGVRDFTPEEWAAFNAPKPPSLWSRVSSVLGGENFQRALGSPLDVPYGNALAQPAGAAPVTPQIGEFPPSATVRPAAPAPLQPTPGASTLAPAQFPINPDTGMPERTTPQPLGIEETLDAGSAGILNFLRYINNPNSNIAARTLGQGVVEGVGSIGAFGARVAQPAELLTRNSPENDPNSLTSFLAASGPAAAEREAAYQEQNANRSALTRWFADRVRGATSSATQAVPFGLLGGPLGAIGGFAASEASSAYEEGKLKGLTGLPLAGYTAAEGLIEAIPAAVMQRVGMGGFEDIFGRGLFKGAAKGATGKATKEMIDWSTGKALRSTAAQLGKKTLLEEIPEEVVTELGHDINKTAFGTLPNSDPTTGSWWRDRASTVLNTATETALMMGAGGAPRMADAALTDRAYREGQRNADVSLAEMAKQTNIQVGKNFANTQAALLNSGVESTVTRERMPQIAETLRLANIAMSEGRPQEALSRQQQAMNDLVRMATAHDAIIERERQEAERLAEQARQRELLRQRAVGMLEEVLPSGQPLEGAERIKMEEKARKRREEELARILARKEANAKKRAERREAEREARRAREEEEDMQRILDDIQAGLTPTEPEVPEPTPQPEPAVEPQAQPEAQRPYDKTLSDIDRVLQTGKADEGTRGYMPGDVRPEQPAPAPASPGKQTAIPGLEREAELSERRDNARKRFTQIVPDHAETLTNFVMSDLDRLYDQAADAVFSPWGENKQYQDLPRIDRQGRDRDAEDIIEGMVDKTSSSALNEVISNLDDDTFSAVETEINTFRERLAQAAIERWQDRNPPDPLKLDKDTYIAQRVASDPRMRAVRLNNPDGVDSFANEIERVAEGEWLSARSEAGTLPQEPQEDSGPQEPILPPQAPPGGTKPPTKKQQVSIGRVRQAADFIISTVPAEGDAGSLSAAKKKAMEGAFIGMRGHAEKLGIEVPKLGTYFSPEQYASHAKEVLRQLDAKYPSKPVTPEQPELPEQPAAPSDTRTPLQRFVSHVSKVVLPGGPMNNRIAQNLAKQFFGKSAGAMREALDGIETAINVRVVEEVRKAAWRGIASMKMTKQGAKDLFDAAKQWSDRGPTQVVRDAAQESLQQFSTPPELAAIAVYASGIHVAQRGNLTALEPSAGTGNIATMLSAWAKEVTVNEIDPRRSALLETLKTQEGIDNLRVINVDGEQLDNLLPAGEQYDIVVMNPPFSSSGRGLNNNIKYGMAHIEQALARVKPGGRLVAIMPESVRHNVGRSAEHMQRMMRTATFRASVALNRDIFRKYGTTFPTRILIFDKTGPTQDAGNILFTDELSGHEAIDALADIASENIYERIKKAAPASEPAPKPDREPTPPQPPDTTDAGNTEGQGDGNAGRNRKPAAGTGRGRKTGVPPKPRPKDGGSTDSGDSGGVGNQEPTQEPGGGGGADGGSGAGDVGPEPLTPGDQSPADVDAEGASGFFGDMDDFIQEFLNEGNAPSPPPAPEPAPPPKPQKNPAPKPPASPPPPPPPPAPKPEEAPKPAPKPIEEKSMDELFDELNDAFDSAMRPKKKRKSRGVSAMMEPEEKADIEANEVPEGLNPKLWATFKAIATEVYSRTVKQGGRAAFNKEMATRLGQGDPERLKKFVPYMMAFAEELKRKEASLEFEDGGVYALYKVRKILYPGARPHPSTLVESATLFSVEIPNQQVSLKLPDHVIQEGGLSDAQLEAATQIKQVHQYYTPEGMRKGYLLGDGTGVGKTRTLLGVIWDSFAEGETQAVVLSVKHDLYDRFEDDMQQIGMDYPLIKGKGNTKIRESGGVYYNTFSNLASGGGYRKGAAKQFEALINWLPEDFGGVIVFDEVHTAKNAVASGRGQGTVIGQLVLDLQARYPKARVVYSSATSSHEPRHMAPMVRLHLWGTGTPFPDFETFVSRITSMGLGAQEMISRDLKALGRFTARSISYKGVSVDPLYYELTEAQREAYDNYANFWLRVRQEMRDAMERSLSPANESQFYNANQNFTLRMITAMQTDAVLKAAQEDLDKGLSVVIALMNTDEMGAERAAARVGADETISPEDLGIKESLINFIDNQFPIYQYRDEVDPQTGAVTRVRVTDGQGNPVINQQNLRVQEALLDEVAEMRFPEPTIDRIIGAFGQQNVGEITGRKRRYVNGVASDRDPKKESMADLQAFQDGRKRVIIINKSGATGFDLHSSLRAKNQERRSFYALQLSWSADEQMQMFGRVHRSNQRIAPIIRPVFSDVAGYQRLVTAVTSRLAGMGAATQGDRAALGESLFGLDVDYLDDFGRRALNALYENIQGNEYEERGQWGLTLEALEVMGIAGQDGNVRSALRNNVKTFLNRILLLPLDAQTHIFEEFHSLYMGQVELAKAAGLMDFGVTEIRAKNIRRVGEAVVLHTDADSGAKTELIKLNGEVRQTRLGWSGVARYDGYHLNVKSGTLWAAKRDSLNANQFHLVNVRNNSQRKTSAELADEQNWTTLTREQAEATWMEQYDKVPETRPQDFHIVSGALLPVLNRVTALFSKTNKMKVRRAILKNGTSVVGIEIPEAAIARLKQQFGIGTTLSDASIDYIINSIRGGAVFELDNGWKLQKARVSGDEVIELVLGLTESSPKQLEGFGFAMEKKQGSKRWFVHYEEAGTTLESLFGFAKPVRDLSNTKDLGREDGVSSLRSAMSLPTEDRKPPFRSVDADGALQPIDDVRPYKADLMPFFRVFDAARRDFNIAIRSKGTKNFRGGLLGTYTSPIEMITLRDENSPEVLAHEFAHHLNRRWWPSMMGFLGTKQFVPFRAELAQLDYDPSRGDLSEGFAEYMRGWFAGLAVEEVAPKFHEWFHGSFLPSKPEDHKKLLNLKALYDAYVEQGSLNRVRADRNYYKIHGKMGWAQRISWLKRQFRFELDTDAVALEDVDNLVANWVKKGRGNPKAKAFAARPSNNPLKLYYHHKEKASSFAYDAVMHEVRNIHGEKVYKSLVEILAPVSQDIESFLDYLWARRAKVVLSHGKNPGMTRLDANKVIATYEDRPGFKKAVMEITEWHGHLMHLLVEGGSLSPSLYRHIKNLHPVYVPLFRNFMEERPGSRRGNPNSYVNIGRGVHRISGSGLPPESFVQNMIRYAEQVSETAFKARVASSLASLADLHIEGIGQFIEPMPTPKIGVNVTASQVLESLVDLGLITKEEARAAMDSGQVPDFLTYYMNSKVYKGSDNIVAVWRNGKLRFYRLNPELYSTLRQMDPVHVGRVIDFFLGKLARTVRLTVTTLSAPFQTSNIVRDAFEWSMNTNTRGYRHLLGPFGALTGFARQLKHLAKEDKMTSLYEAMGGSMTGRLGVDRKRLLGLEQLVLAKASKSRSRVAFHTLRHPVEGLRTLLTFGETGPRLTEFVDAYQAAMKEWNSHEDAVVEANLAAADATLNYLRAGRTARYLNKIIPFFNASIRGPEKLLRNFRQHPVRTMVRGFVYITTPTVLLWLKNRDEPWYKELSDYERYAYWNLGVVNDTIVRIPKPHDYGYIFGSLVEASLNYWWEEDPDYLTGLLSTWGDTSLPDLTPVTLKLYAQAQANRNWWGGPIVPEALLHKPEDKQYLPSTHSLYRMLAYAYNRAADVLPGVEPQSPMTLEYVLNQAFGGLPNRVLQAGHAVTAAVSSKDHLTPKDLSIVGRFWRDYAFIPKRSTTQFWARYNALEKKRDGDDANLNERERAQWYQLSNAKQGIVDIDKEIRRAEEEKNRVEVGALYRQKYEKLRRALAKVPTDADMENTKEWK